MLHVSTFVTFVDFDEYKDAYLIPKAGDDKKGLYYVDEKWWWDVDIPLEYVTFALSVVY